MEEKKYSGSEIEVLYNSYGKFIHSIRRESLPDGDVIFYELDSTEQVDLESYAVHGYKLLKSKGLFVDPHKEYTLEELRKIENVYESISEENRTMPEEQLMDLRWLQDHIYQNKFNYDKRYPVEQLDARYSVELEDFMIVYFKFDPVQKKFVYMDMTTGEEVNKMMFGFYDYYPREEIFKQADYSPREIIELLNSLNHRHGLFKRRRDK